MFDKLANLGGVFARKIDHPLADADGLRKALGDLPRDNAFKSLDELNGWFESLAGSNDFPADRLFEVAQQMEAAALPHLKRLSREYFHAARLSRAEEKRLWSLNHSFWSLLAATYERCQRGVADKARSGGLPTASLAPLTARLIAALARVLKWEQFHYVAARGEIWGRMGAALTMAEAAGLGGKAVNLPERNGMTTPAQEFTRATIFQAAALDSLLPLQIEIAERLIAHFLPHFDFSANNQVDCVYWVDLAQPCPPQRLARMPAQAAPSLRFLKPGAAHVLMTATLQSLEIGGEIPAELNLGGDYPVRLLVDVLRHLTSYLAPVPPQRKHTRHRVKHRMSVLQGLVNAYIAFSDEFGGKPTGLPIESWVVENVSRGGFGAVVGQVPGDWLKVGALIAMQPEGGQNWLLGIIRRYLRLSEDEAHVGIQALATQIVAVELRSRNSSSYTAAAGTPGLILLDGNEAGELRIVLPANAFSVRNNLEYSRNGQRFQLAPIALQEQSSEFELARFRQSQLG